jgi:hypothetical protein
MPINFKKTFASWLLNKENLPKANPTNTKPNKGSVVKSNNVNIKTFKFMCLI